MPEKVVPGPICEERSIREAVCIHTKKIFDSCKDEDIALYKQIFFCLSGPRRHLEAQKSPAGNTFL